MAKKLIFDLFLIVLIIFSLFQPANAAWWDKFGETKYGGKLTWRVEDFPTKFDPYNYVSLLSYPFEGLFMHNWTVDPDVWNFTMEWTPEEYWTGCLAKSWEWKDPQTMIIHIREGVHWQDIEPVKGREFTADDLEYHFDRVLGTGHGFTEPDPWFKGWIAGWEKAEAIDKYTVELKFKNPTGIINHWSLFEPATQYIAAPESVQRGIKEWKDCVGTGPWIIKDYVYDVSATLEKNPNYWGIDERHPQNKIPYMDEIRVVHILDEATAIAAIRTGKTDYIDRLGWQSAGNISKTNTELKQAAWPERNFILEFRCDKEPFTDIRVRKALQMSIDRPTIAKSHYGGTVEGKPAGILSPDYKGFVVPYDQWPQATKDEYSYNPEKAKALLVEAGYPKGFSTNVIVMESMDRELIQIIKAYFMDIGVDMEIRVMDFGSAFSLVKAGKHDQMFMWVSMAGVPPLVAMENDKSTKSFKHHNDLTYDAIIDKFRKSNSIDEAQKYTKEADMYFIQHHWRLEIFPRADFIFWQPRFKGYTGQRTSAHTWARCWVD